MEDNHDALDLHQDAEWEAVAVIFVPYVHYQGFIGNILKHYYSQKIKSGILETIFKSNQI